jgi:TolB protein
MRATCQMNRMNNATRRIAGRVLTASLRLMSLAVLVAPLAFGQNQVSEEGHAVFVSQRNGASQLYLLDLNTRQISQLTDTGRGHFEPMAATGGNSLVFTSRQGAGFEIYRGDLGSAWRSRRPLLVGLNRLTMNVTDEISPSLTADGETIVFASGAGIETMNSTGSGRRVILPRTAGMVDISPAVAPDGQTVAFISNRGDVAADRYDVWLFSRATGELRQLTRGSDALGGLSWSGDSKRLAFTTTATSSRKTGIGLTDVETGSFRILSEQSDSNPSLSARGDRLLFVSSRDGDQELYLLSINSGRVERLTYSAGLDDSPIFLATPNVGRPSRVTR